jgi:hypothetical protein
MSVKEKNFAIVNPNPDLPNFFMVREVPPSSGLQLGDLLPETQEEIVGLVDSLIWQEL